MASVPMYCPHKACNWSYDSTSQTGRTYLDKHLKIVHRNAPLPIVAAPQDASGGRARNQPADRGRSLEAGGAPDEQRPGMTARSPGATPSRQARPGSWPAARIIEAIQEWEREHGRPPTSDQWRKATDLTPSMSTVVNHFGTWSKAITAAGFEIRNPGSGVRSKVTREEAIAALQATAREIGHTPSSRWWRVTRQRPAQNVIADLFAGGWRDACEAAGLEPIGEPDHGWAARGRDGLIEAIRAWNGAHGRPPQVKDWHNATADHPGYKTIVREFGSWGNAIVAAGFPKPVRGRQPRPNAPPIEVQPVETVGPVALELAPRATAPATYATVIDLIVDQLTLDEIHEMLGHAEIHALRLSAQAAGARAEIEILLAAAAQAKKAAA